MQGLVIRGRQHSMRCGTQLNIYFVQDVEQKRDLAFAQINKCAGAAECQGGCKQLEGPTLCQRVQEDHTLCLSWIGCVGLGQHTHGEKRQLRRSALRSQAHTRSLLRRTVSWYRRLALENWLPFPITAF